MGKIIIIMQLGVVISLLYKIIEVLTPVLK